MQSRPEIWRRWIAAILIALEVLERIALWLSGAAIEHADHAVKNVLYWFPLTPMIWNSLLIFAIGLLVYGPATRWLGRQWQPRSAGPLLPIVAAAQPERTASENQMVYLRENSPKDVTDRINSLKPLERELVAKQTYVGRWVRWSGKILGIEPFRFLETGGYTVTVEGGDPFVYARLGFLPTERHLVEPLKEGDPVNYEAKITHVLGTSLYLSDVTLIRQP
jgi:hypothetical protein